MEEEIWVQIFEFPNYSVSSHGRIRNDDHMHLMRQSVTRDGTVKVGMVIGGQQYTRSVKRLVAEAFLPEHVENFNTPLQLDGNHLNCRADNIIWRPLWFVQKYKRQFSTIAKYVGRGPLVERRSQDRYTDIVEASLTNGLLAFEVHMSLVHKTAVFPTWQIFDWVREP